MKAKDILKEDRNDYAPLLDADLLLLAQLCSLDSNFQSKINNECGEQISWKQMLMLNSIGMFEEEPSYIEIANRMDSSYQNVKHMLLSLEREGLVQITTDSKDKRKQRVALTDRSREYCKQYGVDSKNIAKRALAGITDEQIQTTIDTILKIKCNLRDSSEIVIKTHENKEVVGKQFSFREIYRNKKGRPHYQLYASNSSSLKVSGINRWIIGFYENKEDMDLELEEIAAAMNNNESEYKVHYFTPVVYDRTGMPKIKSK